MLRGFFGRKNGPIGHSRSWHLPRRFTSVYRGSPTPTRYHLVEQLTKPTLPSLFTICDLSLETFFFGQTDTVMADFGMPDTSYIYISIHDTH